jgi:hypothetical protein
VRVPLGSTFVAAFLLLLGAGCEDIRRFEGSWAGSVSRDPAHQQGFTGDASMHATVGSVSRRELTMTVDLPGQPAALPFQPIGHASDDVLGDLRLEGEPLRTFLGFVRPPTGEPYLAVVSLFAEDHIDIRIIRGPNETYGVFSLRRQGR